MLASDVSTLKVLTVIHAIIARANGRGTRAPRATRALHAGSPPLAQTRPGREVGDSPTNVGGSPGDARVVGVVAVSVAVVPGTRPGSEARVLRSDAVAGICGGKDDVSGTEGDVRTEQGCQLVTAVVPGTRPGGKTGVLGGDAVAGMCRVVYDDVSKEALEYEVGGSPGGRWHSGRARSCCPRNTARWTGTHFWW